MEQGNSAVIGRQFKILIGVGLLGVAFWFLFEIRGILLPFILAFLLAYMLAPLVDRLEARGLSRVLSILLIFILAFSGLILGLWQAGSKLTREMIDLSEQFLVKEEVDRDFSITNLRDRNIVLTEISAIEEGAPFSLEGHIEFPLEVGPSERRLLRFRFSPGPDEKPATTNVLISSPSLAEPFELRLRGNTPLAANDPFWSGNFSDSTLVRGIEFSGTGIDFGRAGRSIITRLSDEVDKVQGSVMGSLGVEGEFDISDWIRQQGRTIAEKLLGGTSEVLGGVFSGLTFAVIVPFVAFFLLKEGKRITRGVIELVPNAYFELCLNLLHQINGQIGGYIRGLILATTVVGALSVGGLMLIGVPYALPVGIIAGLANMIPFLGPIIGIVSASIVALATGGGFGMVGHVLIVFALIQLIDNILVQPVVLAKSVDLHPLIVLFVVLVGGQLMGLKGMLIAVPMTGIIKVSTQTILEGVRRYRIQ